MAPHNNTITYYNNHNNMQRYSQQASPSSSSTTTTQAERLGQIRAQLELARNFYDDYEFCPVQCSTEVLEHRERIQQRLSPQSSPNTSPNMSYRTSPSTNSRKAIPIINPNNMAPVSVAYTKSPTMWNGVRHVLVQ